MFQRKFKLRWIINNFPYNRLGHSNVEVHFGVPWYLSAVPNGDSHTCISLGCEKQIGWQNPRSIKTLFKFEFPTVTGVKLAPITHSFTFEEEVRCECPDMHSDETIMGAIRDNTFIIDCEVTILSMKGVRIQRFMSFDQPDKDLTDVVIEVGEKKFQLSKEVLATYFKNLFFSADADPQMSTVNLREEDPEDFHSLVEIIAGYKALNDDNVVGVLKLARQFDVEKVLYRCELCLIGSTQFENDQKIWLGDKYELEELLYHVNDNIKSLDEWKASMPSNAHALRQQTLALFHDKIFDL